MKSNAINLYKHFCEMVENPRGADSLQRKLVKDNCIKAKKDMENRFRTASKYKNDPEIKALLGEDIKKETKTKNGK